MSRKIIIIGMGSMLHSLLSARLDNQKFEFADVSDLDRVKEQLKQQERRKTMTLRLTPRHEECILPTSSYFSKPLKPHLIKYATTRKSKFNQKKR